MDLRRIVHENSMTLALKTSVDAILASLDTLHRETVDKEVGAQDGDELDKEEISNM